jgi:hypothetical protein
MDCDMSNDFKNEYESLFYFPRMLDALKGFPDMEELDICQTHTLYSHEMVLLLAESVPSIGTLSIILDVNVQDPWVSLQLNSFQPAY